MEIKVKKSPFKDWKTPASIEADSGNYLLVKIKDAQIDHSVERMFIKCDKIEILECPKKPGVI